MSTIWRALCLDHSPLITVDLFNGAYEARSWEQAADALPSARESHPHCDLVLGGFSYPLVAVACVGGPAHCHHRDPRVFEVEELRLALAAWVISYPADDPMHQQLSSAHDRWMNSNRCWPKDRLSRLAGEMGLVIPGAEQANTAAPAEAQEACAFLWADYEGDHRASDHRCAGKAISHNVKGGPVHRCDCGAEYDVDNPPTRPGHAEWEQRRKAARGTS